MSSVSFVIPCLNEAAAIGKVVDEANAVAAAAGFRHEIIVVDNGSTDGSGTIAEERGASVIDQPVRGYGAAILAGIAHAGGDAIVIADADGQHDLSCTPALLGPLGDRADIVIGKRVHREGSAANHWLKRRVGAPALSAMARALSGAAVSDFHCGFRAARRAALRSLPLGCDGMEFATEMIVRAHIAGLRLAEVPVLVRPPLRERAPHLRPIRDAVRHVRCMVEIKTRTSPDVSRSPD